MKFEVLPHKMMKILIYGINYAPELTGIGRYTAEMAETLAERGHEVRVVCAPPYYPEWRVADGFSPMRYASERRNKVRISRTPLWVPTQPKGARRVAHLASFALSSLPVIVRHALWRPSAVICVAPSLLNAPAACLVARVVGAHSWLHIQDYEVDAAFSLGMLRGSLLKHIALAMERYLLKRFDTVSTISKRMVEHAIRKGVPASKVVRFSNWVNTDAIYPLGRCSRMRRDLSIDQSSMVILYSGNMGAKQGLEVLADVAVTFVSRDDLVFVFCGNGPAREMLATRCGHLPNCRLIDLQPLEQLNELLNLADIHVLPQRADAADLVMPSKLTGMLASGRAVIAMANPGTELYDAVVCRGIVVPPGQPQRLVEAIERLAENEFERIALGKAGREFAREVLSREAILGEFEKILQTRTYSSKR